jgi:hypothetical protein
MSRNDSVFGFIGSYFGQASRNVFVGQTMKSVAANAFRIELQRDGIVIGEPAMAAMKGGIETSDLRKSGAAGKNRPDWS